MKKDIKVLIGFLTLTLIGSFPGVGWGKGYDDNQKNSSSVQSQSCFGPNTKNLLLDREKGLKQFNVTRKAENMYQAGSKSEKTGNLKQAYIYYTLSDMAFKLSGAFPHHIPALIGKYRIVTHCMDKEIETAFGCLALADFYDYYRRIMMFDKIEQIANESMGKRLITPEDKSRLKIMKAFINLMKSIIAWDALAITADNNGILFFGDDQIELLVKGLLQYGVLLRNGNWEIVGKSDVIPDLNNLQKEKRGILNGRALRFSRDASFVPGLRSLKHYEMSHKQQTNVWWERIIADNLWEYSIFDRSIDKERHNAFALMTKGRMLEVLGQNEEAALCYYGALNILGLQFQEPLIRLYKMKSLKERSLTDFAKASATFVEHVDSIRSQLIGLLNQAGDNSNKKQQIDAAIYHSYLLKNMVLGRIFALLPQESGHISAIIGLAFLSAWTKGMKEYGVKLPAKRFRVDRLSKSDWDATDKMYVSSGFWQGCWLDSNGNIMVPGIVYLTNLIGQRGG